MLAIENPNSNLVFAAVKSLFPFQGQILDRDVFSSETQNKIMGNSLIV